MGAQAAARAAGLARQAERVNHGEGSNRLAHPEPGHLRDLASGPNGAK
jgi:hypothetical protein